MGRRRRRLERQAGAGAEALPEAIAALSRTLPTRPNPETFRRAKFDLPEAAPALWRLLFHVLLREDDGTAVPYPEAQVRLVKSALRAHGYPRPALTQLPEDGSQGSRELLLALSWLLAGGSLLGRLLTRTHVLTGDQMPMCECEDLAHATACLDLPAPCKDTSNGLDMRYVQWLMGKLRFRWLNLICGHQEQCALLSKIHQYTQGCHSNQSLGHLSAAETELLRDPEAGQQLLWRLERENGRLEAALEWRRLEPIFWQWMDTVLGACPQCPSDTGPQPTFQAAISDRGHEELELVTRELQALWQELQLAAEARRTAWEAQVQIQGLELSTPQVLVSEAMVERQLATLRQAWEQWGALPHGPHRLVRPPARETRAWSMAGPKLLLEHSMEALPGP
ncbi:tubulin epsilon and delta complex protein 1 isoform X2 [Echinops telfairi]|uniref:Tubulin epsilon and delta complex protein 1 isoform X2 n=1 Tax=Echinops telfairi TaxID=9371 RepID=A0AC55CXE2_ECHTE|nr:tubulin epsilon and delta complex protein 1 isoform X2 [Echinops telfairi]